MAAVCPAVQWQAAAERLQNRNNFPVAVPAAHNRPTGINPPPEGRTGAAAFLPAGRIHALSTSAGNPRAETCEHHPRVCSGLLITAGPMDLEM